MAVSSTTSAIVRHGRTLIAPIKASTQNATRRTLMTSSTAATTAGPRAAAISYTKQVPLSSASSTSSNSRVALFHTSRALSKKKKGKDEPAPSKKSSGSSSDSSSSKSSAAAAADPSDPFNFDDVHAAIERHHTHYREQLKSMRTGGKFSPEAIGAVPVEPDHKNSPKEVFPLRELASVVPHAGSGGRAVAIVCHEERYVKPVSAAIQQSRDFNQQPQRDPDDEGGLTLVLKVEAESREEAGKRVKAACNEWRDKVRAVRQKRDKAHSTWKQEKKIGPDDKVRAGKELDKVIKKHMDAVDGAEKEALKAAQSGR